MSIPSDNPKIVYGPAAIGAVTATPGSVASGGLDDGTYYVAVLAFMYIGGAKYYSTKGLANGTTSAGAGKGKLALSWASVEHADGYVVCETNVGYTNIRLVATYEDGAWSSGTGGSDGLSFTFQTTDTVSGALPNQLAPVTLWLPKKFSKWPKNPKKDRATIKRGHTYVQRSAFPSAYEVDCRTHPFTDTSEDWDGSGSEAFTTAWARFFDNWGHLGKVFKFYRKATDSSAGISYFDRCVWDVDHDGLDRSFIGRLRYALDISFSTEGAAR